MLLAKEKKEIDLVIKPASFYESDPTKTVNRYIIVGNVIYRSIDDLISRIKKEVIHPNYPTRYVIYGDCDVMAISFTKNEIDKIRKACKDAGVSFFYYLPG